METNSVACASHATHSIHVHNYSLIAIQSFISEVKKYPVLYNRNPGVPKGLIDFAWAKIVAALLDESISFDLEQRGYWDRSFRELWKWMQLVLSKDMLIRRNNPIHVRAPGYNWLVHLKFLEPFIQMNDFSVTSDSGFDPDIQIKVETSETVIDLETSNHVIISLRDATEPEGNGNMSISILLRVPVGFSALLRQKHSNIGDSSHVSQGENQQNNEYAVKNQALIVISKNMCYSDPCTSISIQNQQAIMPFRKAFQEVIKVSDDPVIILDESSSNEEDALDASSLDIENQHAIEKFSKALEKIESTQNEDLLPGSSQMVDEDREYIMSLLPKLRELDRKRNAEMKVIIIQALRESLG